MDDHDVRAQFLTDRRQGIGGSDMAALMGWDPYRTPVEVWLAKTGRADEMSSSGNKATERGIALEPTILEWYRRTHVGPDHDLVLSPPTQVHAGEPWMRGNADGLVQAADGRVVRGVEAKSAFGAVTREFGADGTDQVPDRYLIQCQHYMAVYDVDRWDLAAFLGDQFTGELRRYVIPRDNQIIERVTVVGWKFWRDHVETDTPPAPTTTASRSALTRAMHPGSIRPMLLQADANAAGLLTALRDAERARAAAVDQYDALRSRVEEIIGSAQGIESDAGRVTWRNSATGSRSFRTYWKDDDNE